MNLTAQLLRYAWFGMNTMHERAGTCLSNDDANAQPNPECQNINETGCSLTISAGGSIA
jgi:hypothetical protein